VGEDLSSDQMFEYVSLLVLAAQDGTDIQIDVDGDGTTDITQTLNHGESYQVDGGIDTGANLVHDWGFSLLPESYLTPMALVGWGPGSEDLSQNGSPVWVTAAAAATVYVDYDGAPPPGLMSMPTATTTTSP
jgi:hypothetical protein